MDTLVRKGLCQLRRCVGPACALLLALGVVWSPGSPCSRARADELDPWQARPNSLEVHVGAGTPVGYLGLVYERVLWILSANAGFGVGSAREDGGSLQLAAGTKLRVLQGRDSALYLGADYSTGGFRAFEVTPLGLFPDHSSGSGTSSEAIIYSDRAHWLSALVGGESRTATGYVFRVYVGLGSMLNPGSRRCVDAISGRPCPIGTSELDVSIPVVGFSFGAAM